MLSHEEFFLYTVEDLRNRIKENTPYSIIRACGLCRQLVEDENWLLKKANQRTNIKLSFIILDYNRDLFQIPVPIVWITVDPSSKKTIEIDRDAFLKTYVLRLDQHTYNVRDIIKVAANKMGGVHSDDPHPNDLKNISFYDFDKAVLLDYSATINALTAICKVVLNTSEKLEVAIKR